MECPIGGPRCSEGYAKGNPAPNCSPKSYTTERPSPRSGRGRVRRCGGLTPAAVAPPRGRVRRAGRRPRRARAAPRGKGACKQVRFSWSPPLFSPWGGARSEMELFAKIRAVGRSGRAEILPLLPRSAGHLSRAQTQWLVKLAQAIDWGFLEQTFGAVYTDSRPSFANLKPQACRSMCDIDLAPSVLGWRSPRARHPSRMTRAWHAHGVRSFTIGRSRDARCIRSACSNSVAARLLASPCSPPPIQMPSPRLPEHPP